MSPLLAGLLAGAVALLLRAWALARARRDRERLADTALLRRFAPAAHPLRQGRQALLLAVGVGILAAVAAGAGAREVTREERPGPETVLVLDASNSMLAQDVEPSRIERQRELAARLVGILHGKVGVVYFAGRGYVLAPLTVDASAVRMYVEAVRPSSVGRGGTALEAGISEALSVLAGGRSDGPASVVLFSDGEETVGTPLEVTLERAARAGVPIHTVGIGTADGGPIPVGPGMARDPLTGTEPSRSSERRGGYLRGPDGEVVVSRLHEEMLRTIAEATGGSYRTGDDRGIDALGAALTAGSETPEPAGRGIGSGWLLAVAFALLWLEAFALTGARSRREDEGKPHGTASLAVPVVLIALAVGAAQPAPGGDERARPAFAQPQELERQGSAAGEPESPMVARYRAEADRSDRPIDWYNLGTALLRDGRWAEAAEPLRRAAGSETERIRSYGEYNRGLATARRGREEETPPDRRRQTLLEARESFREVLRLDPTDEDARWNLEVVERWLERPPMAGGGGGGDGSGGGDGEAGGGDLDRQAAEALLDEAARAEAELRERVLERTRLRDPVVERNW